MAKGRLDRLVASSSAEPSSGTAHDMIGTRPGFRTHGRAPDSGRSRRAWQLSWSWWPWLLDLRPACWWRRVAAMDGRTGKRKPAPRMRSRSKATGRGTGLSRADPPIDLHSMTARQRGHAERTERQEGVSVDHVVS